MTSDWLNVRIKVLPPLANSGSIAQASRFIENRRPVGFQKPQTYILLEQRRIDDVVGSLICPWFLGGS
jgi:hypothetical protein